METHSEFHIHHDAPAIVGRRERLGVRLLIVADASFVVAMIFTWFYLRNLNANNGWLPKGVHTLSNSSGWVSVTPFFIAAFLHLIGRQNASVRKLTSWLVALTLLVGLVIQFHQLSNMHLTSIDDKGNPYFNGAYASSWVMMGGANLFHYILGFFVALGLAIRGIRVKLAHDLEEWRQATAGSWFTWIAISGLLCAFTMMFK